MRSRDSPQNNFISYNSRQHMVSSTLKRKKQLKASVQYDVMFQNRALENIMGCVDIQTYLNTQSLLIKGRLHTLN